MAKNEFKDDVDMKFDWLKDLHAGWLWIIFSKSRFRMKIFRKIGDDVTILYLVTASSHRFITNLSYSFESLVRAQFGRVYSSVRRQRENNFGYKSWTSIHVEN